ncbi:MAG: alpha-2-macroglobulin family protein, partial [Pseudomonadota bacterium]
AAGAKKTRSQFSTLAFWSTEVILDANGQAFVKVPFNDSLTQWRLVAVVLDGADQFGTGQASVQTTQPVQIFSGLPPVVRSGDTLMQQVTVRNSGTVTMALLVKAQLTLKTVPGITETSSMAASRQIRLAPGQSLPVSWSLAVPEDVSVLAWKISATGADGHLADVIEVEQLARPALPVTVRQATLLQLRGSASVPVVMPSGAQAGRGGVGVVLQGSLVKASLAEMQRWMADYPYACLEQSSSKAAVAGDKIAWDALMNSLPTYLDAYGLAKYFPESSLTGSEMLTAHLLDVAAAQGWEIPAASRDRMLIGLRNIMLGQRPGQDWSPNGSQNTNPSVARLLALQATLMEQGALDRSGKLPVQPEDPGRLPTMALTDWARALLAQSPQSRSAADLATTATLLRSRYDVQGSRLNWRDEESENWWWFMWNGDVAAARTALVLQKWQALDTSWTGDIPMVITGLVGRQKQGRWSTTAANVWASIALRNFAASAEKELVSGSTQVSLASQPRQMQTLNWPQPAEALFPLGKQPGGDSLLMTHQGPGAPWANVSIKAAVRLNKAVNAGMQIDKTITAIEQKVKGQWSVGDVARVRLSMQSQADLTWVVVNDPVPSGATILGRGLARESSLAQKGEREAGNAWPSYVERAADSYRAYYRWVPRGSWSTEYSVRINNAGQFRFPATRVEAMYAPEIFAETPNV